MALADIGLVRELIELQASARALPLAERRRHYDRAEHSFGGLLTRAGDSIDAGGCRAEWVSAPRTSSQPVLVYIHGGGYCLGSSRSHRHLSGAVGRAAGFAVLSLDYRLAPEHAFPAAVWDALAAVGWLTTYTRAPVALAGDSAGGGLAIATMLALRDRKMRLPCACVCLSPWVDLTCESDAYTRLALRDPLVVPRELRWMAERYLRGTDPHDSLASPIFTSLNGLPPLLIQVGTEEILLGDARALAHVASEQGVDVTLEEWPGMVHVWQWYHPLLEQGRHAVDRIGEFLVSHANRQWSPIGRREVALTAPSTPEATRAGRAAPRRAGSQPTTPCERRLRIAPASPIQEAHLRIAPWTSGRGFLSWVYQLNGPLDLSALARALDDVVRRHEILRVRFECRGDRFIQVATPFEAAVLRFVDLAGTGKREALETAVADACASHDLLSPLEDPRFRATLYTIDRKTSVLAMFVAEALVDSDSGGLLSRAITLAYAHHSGTSTAAGLPVVSDTSHLDYTVSHPADPVALRGAREHWLCQERDTTPPVWPAADGEGGSIFTFALTPRQWEHVVGGARALGSTPYILVLTCLQAALARTVGLTRFLAHSVVSTRDDGAAQAMIGNFHSLVRINMRLHTGDTRRAALNHTAVALADAIEHRALPAPLASPTSLRGSYELPRKPAAGTACDPLGDIRFYMFSSNGGPVFAGVRRRRFRLHGVPCAALALSSVFGPGARQDFVFSSTLFSRRRLTRIAAELRAEMRAAIGEVRTAPQRADADGGSVAAGTSQQRALVS